MIYYGINPVFESLNSNNLPDTIYAAASKDSSTINSIIRIAEKKNIPVIRKLDLKKLCQSDNHQGVCAHIASLNEHNLFQTEISTNRFIMFDGIQDPHNFGAALRVCEVFGFKHVIFHKGNSSGLTSTAIKVSSGAAFHLNLYQTNLNSAIKRLKHLNFQICILDNNSEQSIYEITFPKKICFVIGSENKGVRFSIKRKSDITMKIPLLGKVDSLNVSCALSAVLSVYTGFASE